MSKNLFEVVAPSDKMAGQKQKAVRNQGDFGQNWGINARFCPK
ncbi:hypothetical protein [Bacillus sp. ISL-39]|nr:hypothetical protein [Bacillus sp. ISL-39]